MYEEESEPRYVSYEQYDNLRTEKESIEENYHNVNFKLEELVSYIKEILESKDYENKMGEFYELCKENKYF